MCNLTHVTDKVTELVGEGLPHDNSAGGDAQEILKDVMVGMDWERHLNWLEPWEPVWSSMGETYLLTWETQLT